MNSYQRKVELVGQLKQIAKSMESDLRASKKQNILDTVPKDTAKKMCAAFLKKNMSPAKLSDIELPKPRNNKTVKSKSPIKRRTYNRKEQKDKLQRVLNNYTPEIRSMKNVNMNNSNLLIRNGNRGLSPGNINNNEWNEQGFGIVKTRTPPTRKNNTTRKSTKRPQLMSKRNISRRMKLPCPPGQVRGPKGYCRKAEYATKNYNKDKPCKEGKVKGPKGYCRKIKNINVTYKKKNPNQKTRNVRKNVTKKVRISNEDVKIPYEDIGQRGEETPNNYSPMKENPRNISPVTSLSNVSNENIDRMLKKDNVKMLKQSGEQPNNYNPVGSPSNVSNNEWNEMIPARYKDLVN